MEIASVSLIQFARECIVVKVDLDNGVNNKGIQLIKEGLHTEAIRDKGRIEWKKE